MSLTLFNLFLVVGDCHILLIIVFLESPRTRLILPQGTHTVCLYAILRIFVEGKDIQP